MTTRSLNSNFLYVAHNFVETTMAPGYTYANEYIPPGLVSWFPQAAFSFDLNYDGNPDVIVPMNRGYMTGLDTRTHFLAFESKSGRLVLSPDLNEQMPITVGARRAEPVYLDYLGKEAFVTVAHETGDQSGADMILISQKLSDGSVRPSGLLPPLPDSEKFGRPSYVDAHSLASGDINGDGLDDLVVGHWGHSGMYALYQTNKGLFRLESPEIFGQIGRWPVVNHAQGEGFNLLLDLHITDVTNNGFGDLVVGWGHGSTNSHIFFNNLGDFSSNNKAELPESIYGINNQMHLKTFSGDFNGNGHNDLLILWSRFEPYYGGHYLQFLRNDGAGKFVDETLMVFRDPFKDAFLNRLEWSNDWQVFDINNNGSLDIVGASASNLGEGVVFMNNGDGRFIDYTIKTPSSFSSPIIQWGDFNGNGNLEYMTLEQYWNNPEGSSSTNNFNIYKFDLPLKPTGRISYEDISLAFDISGNAGQAYRIYKAAFDRVPDQPGLGYWINDLDNGAFIKDVAGGFMASTEFKSLYGANPTDQQFISLLYKNVLGRELDEPGLNYWIQDLARGETRASLLVNFSESQENQDNVAELIGNGIAFIPWVG